MEYVYAKGLAQPELVEGGPPLLWLSQARMTSQNPGFRVEL